jgi:RNA polymerase sigma factor (sigma-70 family)
VGNNEDGVLPLATRLARLWAADDRAAFYALVVAEAAPQWCRMMVSGLRLQECDADDCIAEAIEAFLDRPDGHTVSNPHAYLARSAWNRGTTFHRQRRRELVLPVEALSPSADPEASQPLVEAAVSVSDQWAMVAVEETLGEVEAEESWATLVVEEALAKLTAQQRQLIRHLSHLPFDFDRKDFDVRSQEAAASLGMTPEAFRKAKQRAYETLRKVIPQVVADLRIQPPARYVAAFEETRGRFMADEPDDGEA